MHEFAAISQGIAERIQSAYQREARVIYPPVEIERFPSQWETREIILSRFSRLVAHKRLDLIIEAFSKLNLPLKIIGDGPEKKRLQKRCYTKHRIPGLSVR